jgi:hypothetical protein
VRSRVQPVTIWSSSASHRKHHPRSPFAKGCFHFGEGVREGVSCAR